MAGAVFVHSAGAQDTSRVRRDSARVVPIPDSVRVRDSLARLDSLAKRDTIKAPLAHSDMPPLLAIGAPYHWNRDELFATGALTVQDLLSRVPGMAPFRTGWIAAPTIGAYIGDARRVRVFVDGVERDEIDPRANGILDVTQISLWAIEDASIEVGAGEVRVYLRSWRVVNTTASTRTDIATGDQQTNQYRGFYGRRGIHGEVVQFAAQEYGTTPPSRFGASSDQLALFGRLGWAARGWSVDGVAYRSSRHRGVITADATGDSIAGLESTRLDAYLRTAYGDPDTSVAWVQLLAVGTKYNFKPNAASTLGTADTISRDTSAFRSQYVLTGGTAWYGVRLSATERLRAGAGPRLSSPTLRASYFSGPISLSAFASAKDPDSLAHVDVQARLTPLSFVSLLAAAGRTADRQFGSPAFTSNYLRGEVGLRVHELWLTGGVIRRDSVVPAAPTVFGSGFVPVIEGPATAGTVALRGRIWGPFYTNSWAVRWTDSIGVYRPQYQTRSELYVATQLLKKFPSGNLSLLGSIVHEYRSGTHFPTENGLVTAPGYRTLSSLIEIRIVNAVVFWQFRNFLGERYTEVPGFANPRQTNVYGARWQFWN